MYRNLPPAMKIKVQYADLLERRAEDADPATRSDFLLQASALRSEVLAYETCPRCGAFDHALDGCRSPKWTQGSVRWQAEKWDDWSVVNVERRIPWVIATCCKQGHAELIAAALNAASNADLTQSTP
jgi:hypothetical protein